jgi:hypothetical protein
MGKASSSQAFRHAGSFSTLSGADEGLYMEVQRRQNAKDKIHHPLFKKFYYQKK